MDLLNVKDLVAKLSAEAEAHVEAKERALLAIEEAGHACVLARLSGDVRALTTARGALEMALAARDEHRAKEN